MLTQSRLVVRYRRFKTTFVSHLQGSVFFLNCLTLEYGTDRSSQNVGNYKSTPRSTAQEQGTCINTHYLCDIFYPIRTCKCFTNRSFV